MSSLFSSVRFFSSPTRPPPRSTLFPYTTLFRSVSEEGFSPRYDLDRWSGLITKPGHKLEGLSIVDKVCFFPADRKSTRLNSSHTVISYAVFCLKKKKKKR